MGFNYKIECVLKYRNGLPITTNKGEETPAVLNAPWPLRSVFRVREDSSIVSECRSTRILLGFRVAVYSEAASDLRVTCYSEIVDAPCFLLVLFCLGVFGKPRA